jgi:hypothetical protein
LIGSPIRETVYGKATSCRRSRATERYRPVATVSQRGIHENQHSLDANCTMIAGLSRFYVEDWQ